jgi:hypothetical protein
MRQWLGRARRERSAAFEDSVADALRARDLLAKVRIPMTALGAPAKMGEIDVLAWSEERQRVLIVECKDLMQAKMEAEIVEQLNNFRGSSGDELDVHLKRMKWLRENRIALQKFLRLSEAPHLADLLVTSRPVPMQYTKQMPSQAPRVFDLDSIDEALSKVRLA